MSKTIEGAGDAVWFRLSYIKKVASSLANSNIPECCISQISLNVKFGRAFGTADCSSFYLIDPNVY